MQPAVLLASITQHYLESPDFNGMALRTIAGETHEESRRSLRLLVEEGQATIVFGDIHPNPHVRALADEPIDACLAKLDRLGVEWACAYPTRAHLETIVTFDTYAGTPYAYELAVGCPQLSYRAFELDMLESYRNDPRFYYEMNDMAGQIYARAGAGVREGQDAWLRFGIAFNDDRDPFIAVYLWDLFKMPDEAQQMWKLRETDEKTLLHPDFHRMTMGHFPERMSIYEAFLMELATINEMAAAIGRPPLFRKDFVGVRPKAFGMLLRPTVGAFNAFVLALDKMLSDNINLKFFDTDVDPEREIDLGGGRFKVERKGSLQILEEWIRSKFRPGDTAPMDEMFKALRAVRSLRNKPAHSEVEDRFDKAIASEQRALMTRTFKALRLLRLVLANHPMARSVEVDSALAEGLIWPA